MNVNGINNAPEPLKDATGKEIEFETKEEHATLDRQDFMKLFVTQLQYQDPMNPMDSEAMASQVAQFNMVDLLYKNNSALEKMAEAENMAASVTAISLLGHKVEYQGDELLVTDSGPEPFYIKAPDKSAVTDIQVSIYNQSGELIRKISVGALNPGEKTVLDWDGNDQNGDQVEEGVYRVKIEALDANNENIELETWTTGIVAGIEQNQNGLPQIMIKDGPTIALTELSKVES